MRHVSFPIWGVDEREYRVVCAYLGLTPKPHLYEKLCGYLAKAPFRFEQPEGYCRFLATTSLTRFRLVRLDLVSKIFFPNHPVRHLLNAVIALHECDGEGYREMQDVPTGGSAWFAMLSWAISFALSLMITVVWASTTFAIYLVGKPFRPREVLAGKRVLITGVNRGLGLELLLHCLEQGAEVMGTVRNPSTLSDLMARLPVEAPVRLFVADLSETESLERIFNAGDISPTAIDIVIFSAGAKYSRESTNSSSKVRETFEINYFSAVDFVSYLCRFGSPKSLVFVSSIGRWHGMHGSCGYNASKAALSIWAESLEMDFRAMPNEYPNVLIVEPGLFESRMMTGTKGVAGLLVVSAEEVAGRIIDAILRGRKTLRYPAWFALLTWALCLAGRNIRYRLFAAAK